MKNSGQKKQSYYISQKYKVIKKIGMGSFGSIFLALDIYTNQYYAIKIENQDIEENKSIGLLYKESQIMRFLAYSQHFPRFIEYGKQDQCNYLVMEHLGCILQNLEKLMQEQRTKSFSYKSGLMIGIQMVQRIKQFHKAGFLHRDIKPENFVIGNNENSNIIYLIDYGLSKKYMESKTMHIKCIKRSGLIGTARYTSINTHLAIEQSRRDDLISIGYLIVYFMTGTLPWQNLPITNTQLKFKRISEIKQTIDLKELCRSLPKQLFDFFNHVNRLSFEEEPDYSYLMGLLENALVEKGLKNDSNFEWNMEKAGSVDQNSHLQKVSKITEYGFSDTNVDFQYNNSNVRTQKLPVPQNSIQMENENFSDLTECLPKHNLDSLVTKFQIRGNFITYLEEKNRNMN